MKSRLLYISQVCEPGYFAESPFADLPGGDNEVQWIADMLDRLGVLDSISFSGVHITRGESLPDVDAYDAVMLGGSFHSVNDRFPWQRQLTAWLQAYRGTAKPFLGICGGHQLACSALGANVATLDGAILSGSFPVDLTAAGRKHFLFQDLGHRPVFHFGNGEHVSRPPDGAVVLATRPEMPALALDLGRRWLTIQCHPEADRSTFVAYDRFIGRGNGESFLELPEAPRLLKNFLQGNGIIAA